MRKDWYKSILSIQKKGKHLKLNFLGLRFSHKIFEYEDHSVYSNCNDIHRLDKILENNTRFDHPIGIVISAAEFGKNNAIYQNVTIGAKYKDGKWPDEYPKIGNNITVYAGAVIIGGITIGDNSIIGANAVVTKDVPANCIVAGNPAIIIKKI